MVKILEMLSKLPLPDRGATMIHTTKKIAIAMYKPFAKKNCAGVNLYA